ncbi:hypothetical protein OGAPHI_001451 [Ogataea philodendri]|uniref:Uncharacterized protein n=1 Tax=Ogataea philodendri TaxID=1378263 RepID=A0A9P8PCT7_9ASCO|nr:uncharacterized protein OGAPHI_001451 [Ogataea philodendri]KAH3669330.1 hypothetical protein OGAPHI_001451 [Ogataea philodendri]
MANEEGSSTQLAEEQIIEDIISEEDDGFAFKHLLLEEDEEEDFDAFVQKYGAVKVKYIKKPKIKEWFVNKPYALNFFYNGTLYRTRSERGESGKVELFLDLLYVGIVAKLAASATEEATGVALLKYVLFFFPIWQVWSDIKDFMNYYFNEDLSQKLYMLWILSLLVVYTNATNYFLESNRANAAVIVPYILCRLSLAISLLVYAVYVPQHRHQNILYGSLIIVTCCIWIPVIFVGVRVKIGLAFMNLFLEIASWVVSYHPYTKRVLKLKYSTAINIEHEVERFGAFYVIAIGEFLYSIVATTAEHNFGEGVSEKVGRAIMLLIIAYCLLWLYFNGDGSKKAIHAARRSGNTALLWFTLHMPLISSLILSADAAAELCYADEIENHGLSYYFTGGLCVSLFSLYGLAMLDKSIDDQAEQLGRQDCGTHYVSKFWRLLPRLPIGVIIICLTVADLEITKLIATTMCLFVVLLAYEIGMTINCYKED